MKRNENVTLILNTVSEYVLRSIIFCQNNRRGNGAKYHGDLGEVNNVQLHK